MLKRDLAKSGIPVLTPAGKLDFHALRTAYINFILDVSPDIKTAQELARHESANMTLNVYGRAKKDRCRAAVESVGSLVFQGEDGRNVDICGQQKWPLFAHAPENAEPEKAITPDAIGGYKQNNLVRKRGLEPP
ncbi:MAG: hypothetical protein LIP77_04530 [Planctomycetes bacterium]|nr:hypothetical protein [Planctomycetota bacterium]